MGGKSSKKYDESVKMGERKLSFSSAAMAFGAWPPAIKMCEPTINATLFFATCPEVSALIPICEVLRSYERCAGVPVGTVGKNDWRYQYVEFQCADMIRTINVSDESQLVPTIEGLLHDSLREKSPPVPWWEVVRVVAPGRSAVVVRIDHVIGDGISLVNLMEQILTDSNGGKLDAIIPASMSKKFERKLSCWQSFCNFFKVISYFFYVLTLPTGAFDHKTKFSESFGAKMVYSGKRRLIDFETMPLDYIKALKTAGSVSLNDILFAALGGAIRRYNVEHDCQVTEKRKKKVLCRALMPVAFPRPQLDVNDKTAVLRNKWVFVSADFGAGIDDAVDRIKHVNKGMGEIKSSPYAGVQLYVQETIPPKLPLAFGRKTVFDMISRHSVIFSNVPGPEKAVAFGGQKVTGIQMYFNNLLPQVGILSYEGKIFMNMNMDTEAIPGSEKMPIYFAQELMAMSKAFDVEVPAEIIRRSEM